MARTKTPEYTAEQFRELEARLAKHRNRLCRQIDELAEEHFPSISFDAACNLRDVAQRLTTTCKHLSNIGMYVELAEAKGTQPMSLDLEAIGLAECRQEGE